MTPLRAAKEHCANYQPDGSWLGIGIRDDGSLYRFQAPGQRCALACCKPCQYFEECVVPQVPASTVEEYRKSLPAGTKTTVRQQQSGKLCPDCQKRELTRRQTYCETCAATRKRASKRLYMRSKRGLDVEKQAFISASE
jgi:hypothetical protein